MAAPTTPTAETRISPLTVAVAVVLVAVVASGVLLGLRSGDGDALSVQGFVPSPEVGNGVGPYDGVEYPTPQRRADFVLTTTEGERFDFAAATSGKLTLLYFGYTSCPDICPVHLQQLSSVLARPDMPPVQVVFVGVDPDRDRPEVVRDYLDNFSADFVGLTGTWAEVADAQRAAGVAVAVREGSGPDYLMGHDGRVIAYSPDDLAHVAYPFGTRQTHWVNDLPELAALGSTT